MAKLKSRSKCAGCGQFGHWARQCPNIAVKMIARKDGPCGLCRETIRRGDRLSKVAYGRNINRWAHERCALAELISLAVITAEDAQRAGSISPRTN